MGTDKKIAPASNGGKISDVGFTDNPSIQQKQQIVKFPADFTDDDIENWNERAGIFEYDAGMSRADAECSAIACVYARRGIHCRYGTDALRATAAAGIPLKPFYSKSSDNEASSYSVDLPLNHGEWYKAHLSGYLVLDIDRNHKDGSDGLQNFIAYIADVKQSGQLLPSYFEAILQSGSVSEYPCYTETPSGRLSPLF